MYQVVPKQTKQNTPKSEKHLSLVTRERLSVSWRWVKILHFQWREQPEQFWFSRGLRLLLWWTGSERLFSFSVFISFFWPSNFQTSGNLYIWDYLTMLQAKRNGVYYLQHTAREEAEWSPQEVAPFLKNSNRKDVAGLISPAPSGAWERIHTCSAEAILITYY